MDTHNIINKDFIFNILEQAKNPTYEEIETILDKAIKREKLSLLEIAKLLESKEHVEQIKATASKIKESIYGNRVVMFAPLYISNYCINHCTYCGYQKNNPFKRRKLTQAEIQEEVRILENLGHKRLALEVGEDLKNCSIDYILESIDTIYNTLNHHGAIRRVNVNIAATTVHNYKRLKEKGIGTYILFQETYHKDTYELMHPKGPKSNYQYHLTAFDRAMEAGIDDVGAGVLFGLYDYKYEVLALIQHNQHLEERFNVGFHTVSVPRLKKAVGVDLDQFPHLLTDEQFIRIVTVLRLALPYTGIILSTRENKSMRDLLIQHGVSQISAGSCTGVGGYKENEEKDEEVLQFELSDERSPLEVVSELVDSGYIPSFCTACYRSGRTGDRFMQLAKTGNIKHVCEPNALMTLAEFIEDYGNERLKKIGHNMIEKRIKTLENQKIRQHATDAIIKIRNNERDFYL